MNATADLPASRREMGWLNPDLGHPVARAVWVGVLALLFVAGYPLLFQALGPDVAAIFVLAVLPASIAYGLAGGIVAGVVAVPANMVLLARIGPNALGALSSDWAGAVTGLCVGLATGAGRDLFARAQTQALERERVRLEREIVALTRTERELARANAELDRARGIAEAASRAKTVLLGRVSHELRTPVAAILGYIELLREETHAGALTSPDRDLERIHQAARYLAALLDDLLDIARLESGHFTPRLERISVDHVVRGVSTMAVPLAERRANVLAVRVADASAEVVTDRRRLEQVLLNLLANAAKFTERGRIAIEAAAAKCGGADVVQFTVSDTGVGMTPEQAEHAFEEFYQVDPTASSGGTGLGLAITRHLCQRLGATIALDTAPGRGTAITVTLPLAPPAAGDRLAG
ncbi:MAG TPA: HAMP domain-containing sensor histidine kinase [Anaeromyxobacter sp.]